MDKKNPKKKKQLEGLSKAIWARNIVMFLCFPCNR